MLETPQRLRAARDLFRQSQLLFGELFDALFEGVRDDLSLGFDHAIDRRLDLPLCIPEMAAQIVQAARHGSATHLPGALEHIRREADEVRRRGERFEQSFKLAFDFVALDRLAVMVASGIVAKIIGIMGAPALRPRRRERRATAALHEAAQREILAQILSRGRTFVAIDARENPVVCIDANQRFVASFAQSDAPIWGGHQTCIDVMAQHG